MHGRTPYAATSIGVAQVVLDLAAAWMTRRKTFGPPLADKQAIQWMIADLMIELRVARQPRRRYRR